ncbi:MAG: amino acid-binding protein [Prevotella sp.]|nr:amino acid-binding protein [Prevotella sp.]
MTIHQLSIFMENKSGTLLRVLDLLRRFGIQIIASTIPDTAENGIYRLICSEPLRAYEGLKNADIPVALSEVFALELDDVPGRAAEAVSILSQANISLTYMYSFLLRGKGILVFRPDDAELTRETILRNNMKYIAEKDLSKYSA